MPALGGLRARFALFSNDSTIALLVGANGENRPRGSRGCCCAGAAALALRRARPAPANPTSPCRAAYEAPAGTADALAAQTLDRWWLIFGDEELNGLEDQALRASPDVKTQIARLRGGGGHPQQQHPADLPDRRPHRRRQPRSTTGDRRLVLSSLIPVGGDQRERTPRLQGQLGARLLRRAWPTPAGRPGPTTRPPGSTSRAPGPAWSPTSPTATSRPAAWRSSSTTPTRTLRIETELLRSTTIKAERGLGPQSDADRIAGDRRPGQVAGREPEGPAARRRSACC